MILISGGGYQNCCDMPLVRTYSAHFTALGYQCVSLTYRTPRPVGLRFFQSAWQDGQRAVRIVRSEAQRRGYDPEKVGVIGMSAGAHLAVLLAVNSQTPAYAKVDALDELPCHIAWAFPWSLPYVLSDGDGEQNARGGDAVDSRLDPFLKFDGKTCPMCMFGGGLDRYSQVGATRIYRELRKRKVPAELHLYPDVGHCFWRSRREGEGNARCWGRMDEFLRQMNFDGKLGEEVALAPRFPSDADRASYRKEPVWPEGKMPDVQTNQCTPYLEWHLPKARTTTAIQIIYSGGAYQTNTPDVDSVFSARRYLNAKGMTVVTMKYRTPRPLCGLAKHTTAWQDLQRAVRLVRSQASRLGLDQNRIGVWGTSAGGHLSLLGALSSNQSAYRPIDELDRIPCNVQWAVAIYPAYLLEDGLNGPNARGGNDLGLRLAEELNFDLMSCPVLFLHGDADGYAATGSVRCWERLRQIGVQCELHTLALRKHVFMKNASPGTGSWTWLDRAWEFFVHLGLDRDGGGVNHRPFSR